MSNPIQIVKEMYAAFGRGDVDALMAHLDENVVWSAEGPAEMAFTGIHHGKRETLEGFFGGIAREHRDPRLEMTEFVAQGDSVAAFGRYQATLANNRRVSSPVGHLFQFHNGKVVGYTNLLNTAAFLTPVQGRAEGVVVSFDSAKMSPEQYDGLMRRLEAVTTLPPRGALFHLCYGDPARLRVLDVFDSMESFQSFGKILLPLLQEAGVDPGQPEIQPLFAMGSR